MSALTHKPKLPAHARSPTWSKPREPQQVSNSEVLARQDKPLATGVSGVRLGEDSFHVAFGLDEENYLEAGINLKDPGFVLGGRIAGHGGSVGAAPELDLTGEDRAIGISGRGEFGTGVGDLEVSANVGGFFRVSDDVTLLVQGQQVTVTRCAAGDVGADGGFHAGVVGTGAGFEVHGQRSRSRTVSMPEWLALRANAGGSAEAARQLIPKGDLMASATELEDGDTSSRDARFELHGHTGSSLGMDVQVGAETGIGSGFTAARTGDVVTLSSSAQLQLGGSLESGIGVARAVRWVSDLNAERIVEIRATIDLDITRDEEAIRQIESIRDPWDRAECIEAFGGTVSEVSTTVKGIDNHLPIGPVAIDESQHGSISYESTEDGRTHIAASSVHDDSIYLGGHRAEGHEHVDTALLTQNEDGRYALDLQAIETVVSCRPGLDGEFDIMSPMETAKDLLTHTDVDQTQGLSLDADQVDAMIAQAGTDAWSYGANSRYGGYGDAPWMALGTQLASLDGLPEAERRRAQAELIAAYIRNGGEAEAFERLLDPDHDGRVEGATLTEWPESLVDGPARYEALEAQVDAPDPEQTAALLIDIDLFTYQVAACSDFTMAGAKSDLLERLGEMRDRVSHRRYEELGENYDFDLDFDAAYAQLRTGLGICRAYAGDESRMFSDLDSAHDKEAAVEKLSKFYARWRGAVLNVRECYESLALRPENWKVSAPGGERTDYEPHLERAENLWKRIRSPEDQGFSRRILPKMEY